MHIPSPKVQIALEQMLHIPIPIAFVAGTFPAVSETFVYREIRELRQRGWNVEAVSLHDSADMSMPGMEDFQRGRVIVYGSGLWQTVGGGFRELFEHPLRTIRTLFIAAADAISPGEPTHWKVRLKLLAQAVAGIGLAGRLRVGGTRHLHCHFAHSPASVGMYAAIQLGCPFSFTGHANDLFQRRELLKRKLERAAFVACISHWHRAMYRNIAPADDTIYGIVRCGVDVKSWSPAQPIASSGLHLLTVARLVEKKGIDSLIRAVAAHDKWRLTIAGDGPQRYELQQLVQNSSAIDRIEFLGTVSNQKVRELLQSADIFVLPCRRDSSGDQDGIPVALMEAMSCGVPVISGDLPSIRELITNGTTGLLVNSPSDPLILAGAIQQLADDPKLRANMGAAGRADVELEFALDANVTRLERLLERSISHQPAALAPADVTGMTPTRRYALISPCRDEATYARRTLDSVTRQTNPPTIWVIVDDGSTDQTPQILAEYAAKFPYIKIVTRQDRGDRKLGGGVIDAFNDGYKTINPDDYDYICKLDLDLDLPKNYFEIMMQRMEQNPRIGTCSGKPYYTHEGRNISEMCGDENSVGMAKFYRTACFEQIGGFVPQLMWDGIDGHRCRMNGWIAVSWNDPSIRFLHLRPMGTSHKNWWTGRERHGIGQHFMGTSFIYMVASAIYRMTRPPLFSGGAAMMLGYTRSAWERRPQYGDPAFREFLHQYQWSCLIRGKAAATERLNRRQSTIWSRRCRADKIAQESSPNSVN